MWYGGVGGLTIGSAEMASPSGISSVWCSCARVLVMRQRRRAMLPERDMVVVLRRWRSRRKSYEMERRCSGGEIDMIINRCTRQERRSQIPCSDVS